MSSDVYEEWVYFLLSRKCWIQGKGSADNNMNSSIGVAESRQQERRKLRDMINRDDLFDVFVRLVLAHAPAVYVFFNITLLIWIAQTIFNSKLSAVPNSLSLIAPLLSTGPLSNLTAIAANSSCPPGTSLLTLKTMPTILNPSINRLEFTVWGDPGLQFCGGRLPTNIKPQKSCETNLTLCSGYCVNSLKECPITNIRGYPQSTPPDKGYQFFFALHNKRYYYSREENTPVIALMAAYPPRCANDEHYGEIFDKQSKYWEIVMDCKDEGTIGSFFSEFTHMSTNMFLMNNNVQLTVTENRLQQVALGFVNEFVVSVDPREGCGDSKVKSEDIKPFLKKGPVAPQFTQSLLIIAFILLVAQIFWLIAYYCFPGYQKEKNIFVGLMSIIELVIITFIYSQNNELFYVEKIAETLTRCLKQSLPAVSHWYFGIESPQVFKMVIFVNTSFLGLFITVKFLNSYCFKQLHRRPLIIPGHNNLNSVN